MTMPEYIDSELLPEDGDIIKKHPAIIGSVMVKDGPTVRSSGCGFSGSCCGGPSISISPSASS